MGTQTTGRGRCQYALRYDWPLGFTQEALTLLFSLSPLFLCLWLHVFMKSCIIQDIYIHLFPPSFQVKFRVIAFLFSIPGSEEVHAEQLSWLTFVILRKTTCSEMRKLLYVRHPALFYCSNPYREQKHGKEYKRCLNIGLLLGHLTLKSGNCPITFHAMWQMAWRY